MRVRNSTRRVVIQEITTQVIPPNYNPYPLEPIVNITNNNMTPPPPLPPYDPRITPTDPRRSVPPPPPLPINEKTHTITNTSFKRPADPAPLLTDQRTKISRLFAVPTRNRYAPLAEKDDEITIMEEETHDVRTTKKAEAEIRNKAKQTLTNTKNITKPTNQPDAAEIKKRGLKPPPIVITGVISDNKLF